MTEKLLKYKYNVLKTFVLIGISVLYLERSANDFKEPFIKGDGIEYVIMTEALQNHFTPDMRLADLALFRERYSKVHGWNSPLAPKVVDIEMAYLTASEQLFKEGTMGFYCNKNKKWHCGHFFFYSLVNLPSYTLTKEYGPIRSFYFTNAFFMILACFVILFFAPFSVLNQVLSAICFCFSACYWYLGWQHAEVYTCSLIAIAFVALFNKKYHLAVIILALACLQNQPLIILLGLFCLIAIKELGFNLKNIVKTGLLAAIAFIPPVYYYINFGVTNMIKEVGFLDTKYITANRITGFYTDLSQGMILTIPLILLIYIPLLAVEIRKMFKKQIPFDLTIFIPVAVIGISITVSTMGNWNHGMAIINRYASWASIIIMMHVFYLSHQVKGKVIFFISFSLTQIFTTYYHQQFNINDWSSGNFTPLAKWVLNNHPELYNPDPKIFAGRTSPAVDLEPENSPVIYFSKKIPKKILVHNNKMNALSEFGLTPQIIAKLKKDIRFNYGWGYLNMDLFNSGTEAGYVYQIVRKKKVKKVYEKILNTESWMEGLKKKAVEWNKTLDEACWMDAEYIVSLEEKNEAQD